MDMENMKNLMIVILTNLQRLKMNQIIKMMEIINDNQLDKIIIS